MPTVLGHPAGLVVLFVTEMWERFSFYGMRALLILFMTQKLLLGDPGAIVGLAPLRHLLVGVTGPLSGAGLASQVYGLYSGLVYLTPLLGGALADRVFGRRPMIVAGGLLMIAGHLLLTWKAGFLIALLLIILGTGCFKGNIAGQVGDLYPSADPRRERGFSIFYVGISLGATAAPLACAWLALTYGWNAAFAATTVGMGVGLAVYLGGQRLLPPSRRAPFPPGPSAGLAPAAADKGHMWVLLGIGLCAVSVWISYEQQANAMVRWVSSATGGRGVALSWLQSIPPATVILGTPVLTRLWARQAARGREPSPTRKLTLGAGLIAISQLVLLGLALLPAPWMSRGWLLPACLCGYMALWEVGDLYLSPAAMAIFSRLAPHGRISTAMAGWYLTVFFGSLISGWIGSFWGSVAPGPYWACIAGLSLASVAGFALIERRVSKRGLILLAPVPVLSSPALSSPP